MGWLATVVLVGLAWWALQWWLGRPPPPTVLACRTCRRLQRQIQWLKLWLLVVGIASVAAVVVAVTMVGR